MKLSQFLKHFFFGLELACEEDRRESIAVNVYFKQSNNGDFSLIVDGKEVVGGIKGRDDFLNSEKWLKAVQHLVDLGVSEAEAKRFLHYLAFEKLPRNIKFIQVSLPIRFCGECRKFQTKECPFSSAGFDVIEPHDSACPEFERKKCRRRRRRR